MLDNEILNALLSGGDVTTRHFLINDCDPNFVIDGRPILYWAASVDDEDVVSALLERGANPNGRAEAGDAVLISAAYIGALNIVRRLIRAGADINMTDADGQCALMAAAKAGSLVVVRELVDAGANVALMDAGGRSVLHWAVTEADNEQVVRYLLANGAPKHILSKDGFTAHDYAVKLSRPLSARLLFR